MVEYAGKRGKVILPDLKESQTSFGAFSGNKSRLPAQKSPQSIVRLECRVMRMGLERDTQNSFRAAKKKSCTTFYPNDRILLEQNKKTESLRSVDIRYSAFRVCALHDPSFIIKAERRTETYGPNPNRQIYSRVKKIKGPYPKAACRRAFH